MARGHIDHGGNGPLFQKRAIDHEVVAAQFVLCRRLAKARHVGCARKQSHGPGDHAAHHQLGCLGANVAKRDIGLAAAQVQHVRGYLQIHADAGPALLQALDGGQQEFGGDRVGAGHAHQAGRAVVQPLDARAQVQRRAFHAPRGAQPRLAGGGEQVAIPGAQKQLAAQLGLQRVQAPAHGGLVHAQAARGGAQGGRARQREKDAGVIPVHGGFGDADLQHCRAKSLRLSGLEQS